MSRSFLGPLVFLPYLTSLAFGLVGCTGAPAPDPASPGAAPASGADARLSADETPAAGTPAADAAEAAPVGLVGAPAPAFTLPDTEGAPFSLSDQRTKVVVLEWFNPDCPFVKAAHEPGGPLAEAARTATAAGVVWVAINSGAPGKQGHGSARNAEARGAWSLDHPVLLDETGEVGRAYAAKTTPQLVVIDGDGVVRYEGALDNAPLNEVKDGAARVSWALDALAAVQAGQPVATARTTPWGCAVKY